MSAGGANRWDTIFARILAVFLIVNVLTAGALLYNSYWFSRSSIENRTQENIRQQLAIIKDNFEKDFLVNLRRSMHALESSTLLDDHLLASATEQRLSKRKIEKLFIQTVGDFDSYHALSYVDPDGVVRIGVNGKTRDTGTANLRRLSSDAPPTLTAAARLFRRIESIPLLLSSGNMEWFMPPREVHVEGPYLDERGIPSALAGIAKLDLDTGTFGGVVILRFRLDTYFEYLREVKFLDVNPIWVLDKQGYVLQRPHASDFDPRPYMEPQLQTNSTLMRLDPGIVAYQDFGIVPGEPFLRIAVAIPAASLFRDLEPAIKFFTLVLLGSIAIVLLVSWHVSKYLSRPITALAHAARRLAGGALGTQVEVRASGEVRTLIDNFNAMSEDLDRSIASRDASLLSLENEVAERKRAERELKEQARQLSAARVAAEEAARAKSEFLATMSHEIRTPINGVLGMTELLLTTALDPRQRHFASTVRSSGQALLDVVNDVLDFSKIEAGKLDLHVAPFDLRELIEEMGQLFAEVAHGKGLELVCRVPPALDTALLGDSARLRQVLTNLVGNAVKFTERGEVVVRVGQAAHDARSVTVHCEVIDTGIGISEQAQRHIFESFSQADGSTTRQYGGTGLGLTICKRLIELMGGTMGVRSEPGEGSTFWFDVELLKNDEHFQDPAPGGHLRGARALVVDDNDSNLQVVSGQLEYWGVRTCCASDGAQALATMQAAAHRGEGFDMVLLDADLSDVDGSGLAASIRAQPDLADARVIMLDSVHDDAGVSPGAGIDARLTKPVRQCELRQCIVDLCAPSGAGKDPAPVAPEELAPLGAHVLVVEDNLVNQELALTMLEILDCTADTAVNGLEALEALSRRNYAAVLMDCQMPEMDGFEASREIRRRERADGSSRRNTIIALTANAMPGDQKRCIDAGMDSYLCKPFSLEELSAILRPFVAGERAQGDAGGPEHRAAERDSPLDRLVLAALRTLQRPGAPDVMEKFIGAYFDQAPALVEALGVAVGGADAGAVRAAAHSLKSASANLGAARLAALCEHLEQGAEASHDRAHLLAQVRAEFDAVCEALSRERVAAA